MAEFCSFYFLFNLAIASENAIKTNNDAFAGKYAILKHAKIMFVGHNFPYFPGSFSMAIRPKDAWSYVQRVSGRTAVGGKDVRP